MVARKAQEEQEQKDAAHAKKKEEKERKKREEQEKQRKELTMTDPIVAHKQVAEKTKADLITAEELRRAALQISNPSYFDKELKFAITKLLYADL